MVDHEHMKDRVAKLQGNKMRVEPKRSKNVIFRFSLQPDFSSFLPSFA